jgi:hypothetical protein
MRTTIKSLTVSVLLFLLFRLSVSAQPLYQEAGLRTGFTGGIYYQMTHETGNAETGFMGMLGFRNHGIQVTGLRVIYVTSLDEISPDLYLGWGYGGHAGFAVSDNIRFLGDRYYFRSERFCPLVGFDGWGTIEYRFRTIPMKISLNIKPYIELTFPSFINLMPGDIGISIAYTF